MNSASNIDDRLTVLVKQMETICKRIPSETSICFLERLTEEFALYLDLPRNVDNMLQRAPIVLAFLDSHGNFGMLTGAVRQVFDCEAKDLIGEPISNLLAEGATSKGRLAERIASKEDSFFRATVKRKDASSLECLWDLKWDSALQLFICTIQNAKRLKDVDRDFSAQRGRRHSSYEG